MIKKQIWTLVLYSQEFFLNEKITLQNEEFHYVVHVLRLKINDQIEFSNGIGAKAVGFISDLDKKICVLKITEVTHYEPPKRKVHLILAHLKPTALEEAVFAASELGVSQLHLFKSERGANKQAFKLEKLQKISNEAMRISKSAYSAKIFLYENLKDCLAVLKKNLSSVFLFCDERQNSEPEIHLQNVPLITNFNLKESFENVFIVIGPEASFSSLEYDCILQLDNCHSVSLGSSILRSTTAVTCACFAVLCLSSRGYR